MKLIKAINKYKKISIGLASLVLVVSSASISIYYLDQKTTNGENVLGQTLSKDKKAIEYEYIKTHYADNKDAPTFVYYTTETEDDKLIRMNQKVINELKKNKKINKKTKQYHIDYFNNKDAIKIYYDKKARAKLSNTERMFLAFKLSAQMIYIEKTNTKTLMSLRNGKLLKAY